MESNYAFVDFQGFKDNSNRFILKEFALITKNIKFHDIIKSPAITLDERHQKQTKWLTENYHGIDWNSGNINLSELRRTIRPLLNNKIVYLKGEEKIEWFRHILEVNRANGKKSKLNKIINLESMECTINLHRKDANMSNKFHACKNHRYLKDKKNPKCHCAMENVLILSDWYIHKQKQM